MSGVHRDTEGEAAKRGHTVVWPELDQLFVDCDSEADHTRFLERLALLIKSLGKHCAPWRAVSRMSATPGHWHVTVTMHRPVTSEVERICLQAILGSDPDRELFSWVRHELDARPVSCFFEPVPVQHMHTQWGTIAVEPGPVEPPPRLTFDAGDSEGVAGYDLLPLGYR